MDTYDLDEDDPGAPHSPAGPGSLTGGGAASRRWWPAALVVVLVIVSAAVAIGADQRSRAREFSALLVQVTRAQTSITYSQGRIQSMVGYTSPQLTSARAPERVRAGLRKIVQDAAADRVGPLRTRRAAVAGLPVHGWHHEQRHARDAYLDHVDQQLGFVQAVAADLRALYRPDPQAQRLQAEARAALLAASPDAATSARIRTLLP
jgi:hypothetical protein